MRHRICHRKLNRTTSHRRALRRNLAQSLFEHGQIITTLQKAKDVRPFVEKLITMGRRAHEGSLVARRRIEQEMTDRSLIPAEKQSDYDMMSDAKRAATLRFRSGRRHRTGAAKGRLAFTGESIIHRLINTVAPRYKDRPGGYTRIIRLPKTRIGDNAIRAILQLVGNEESPGTLAKPAKTARRKRADARYAAAIKASKRRGGGGKEWSQGESKENVDHAGENAETQE